MKRKILTKRINTNVEMGINRRVLRELNCAMADAVDVESCSGIYAVQLCVFGNKNHVSSKIKGAL